MIIKIRSSNTDSICTYQGYQWTVNVEKELPYIEINTFEVEDQITTNIQNKEVIIYQD